LFDCNSGYRSDVAALITPSPARPAGADIKRVTILKMVHEANTNRMFSLITDLAALRQKVLEIGDVKMIIIDPISAYLGIGKVDSFRATDVRAVLSPLKELAEELRVSVLGIMHFNKKIDVTNVLLRISDSLAYGAASRHVYAVVNDPDNYRRLFVKGKNNLARYEQKTLAFGIEEREVGVDKRTGLAIRRPYIIWHDEPVDITAAEAIQAVVDNKSPSARDYAKQFLIALLSNGPVVSKEVHEGAKENGIAKKTLERAARDLGVDIKHDGPLNDKGERTWQWHPPTKLED
jgi:putative DNA primase/helicase